MNNKTLVAIIIMNVLVLFVLIILFALSLLSTKDNVLETKNIKPTVSTNHVERKIIDQEIVKDPLRIPKAKPLFYGHLELVEQINVYLNSHKIDVTKISYYITNLETNETYTLNEDQPFIAASVYKLPLAMIYYDQLYDEKLLMSQTYTYDYFHYEEGGPLPFNYEVGSAIPLKEILTVMIQSSDNTAAHILFENLGGWEKYRDLAQQYSSYPIDPQKRSYENYTTAQYNNDLLILLYQNQEKYAHLLSTMEKSFSETYLNYYMPNSTYQKHGIYANHCNAVGLNFEKTPYAISILTDLGQNGIVHIGAINKLVYDYFNSEY